MSCSVCAGYSSYNCPCCSEEVRMMECPDCESGYVYYAFDIYRRVSARVTRLAYAILPVDEDIAKEMNQRWCQGDIEICSTCQGEGIIPENH